MGSLRSSAQAHDLGHLATEYLAALLTHAPRASGGSLLLPPAAPGVPRRTAASPLGRRGPALRLLPLRPGAGSGARRGVLGAAEGRLPRLRAPRDRLPCHEGTPPGPPLRRLPPRPDRPDGP